MVQYLKKFFTYEGRIGRKQHSKDLARGIVLVLFLFFAVYGAIGLIFGIGYLDFLARAIPILPFMSLTILFFPLVKRLHDLNWSGWVFSVFVFNRILDLTVVSDFESESGTEFVFEVLNTFEQEWSLFMAGFSIVTFILLLILIFKKGTAGSNKYGPDPLKV